MKTIKIAGVPEHFNLPWHLCIENGEFEEVGIDLQWKDVPEGTGKMCQMLRDNSVDIAVLLTEGILKDISLGNPSKIVQTYVESPLNWGIHVASQSEFQTISDLKNKKAAISRLGSGSHLMSIIHAKEQNWDYTNLSFEIVNTLDGAVAALSSGKADYFMWEQFMTQPIVNAGVFRRIGIFPTPWPCFVIAVRTDFLEHNKYLVSQILNIINRTTEEFKHIPSIDKTLTNRYNQELNQIQKWLQLTHWSQKQLTQSKFETIQNELLALSIIEKKMNYETAFSTNL